MALTNRADLASAISAWLNRSNLTARIPDFIRLTEAELNLELRDPDQLVATTLTLTNGSASVPEDFGEMVAFGEQGTRFEQVTPGEFGTYRSEAGNPRVYTVGAGVIQVLPSSSSATVPITYYRAIPALTTDGSTNWLLKRLPNIYLFGSLLHAEFYGWNDERLPLINSKYQELIEKLGIDGSRRRWGAAPLAAKVRRT